MKDELLKTLKELAAQRGYRLEVSDDEATVRLVRPDGTTVFIARKPEVDEKGSER